MPYTAAPFSHNPLNGVLVVVVRLLSALSALVMQRWPGLRHLGLRRSLRLGRQPLQPAHRQQASLNAPVCFFCGQGLGRWKAPGGHEASVTPSTHA